jgi:hypothetical protein
MAMLESCSPTSITFQDSIVQANGKEYVLATLDLLVEGCVYFSLDPGTPNGMLR